MHDPQVHEEVGHIGRIHDRETEAAERKLFSTVLADQAELQAVYNVKLVEGNKQPSRNLNLPLLLLPQIEIKIDHQCTQNKN